MALHRSVAVRQNSAQTPELPPNHNVPSPDLEANHNVEIIILCAVLSVVTLVGMAARLASKRMRKQRPSVDDYLLVAAFILYLIEAISLASGAVYAGIGHHVASLNADTIATFSKGFFVGSLLQQTLLALAKLSVLILYRGIFATRKFRLWVDILSGIVIAWWISVFFGELFICWPLEVRWDPTLPAHCGNLQLLDIIAPIPWIVTDIAVILSPLPIIRGLHLPTRQKVALGFLFLIGGLSCIASIVRYQYVFYNFEDATWDTTPLVEWNIVEASVTVLVASLIAAKPAMALLVPEKLITASRSWFSRSYKYISKSICDSRSSKSSSTKLSWSGARNDSTPKNTFPRFVQGITRYESGSLSSQEGLRYPSKASESEPNSARSANDVPGVMV